jgi:hypothetical protein
MSGHEPGDELREDLAALLARIRPELVALCCQHCLTPEETQDVIYENSFFLARRWRRTAPEKRAAWLLAAVEEHCRRQDERRAQQTRES